MAATYRGKGGKRGPGSRVTFGGRGTFKTAKTPTNSWATRQARRYKAMRGSGVVKDSGNGGNTVYSPRGHGGKRGNKSNRVVY